MAFTALKRLFGPNETDSMRVRRQTHFQPRLECLEERIALATLYVGSSPGEYLTIQGAVSAAHARDKIVVDPGIYQEQVVIPATKTGLRLISAQPLAAIIKAPAVMTGSKAIVSVHGAEGVTIRGFTIAGPGGGPSDSIRYGIRIVSGGSATIINNRITEIRDTPVSGSQNGIAILVGHEAEATTGSATISNNIIDNYQKAAIQVSNVGSCAEIEDNKILGIGPTDLIAQNGIQVDGGARAEIRDNAISGHSYSPQTFAGAGILLVNPGDVEVDSNALSGNDVGIWVIEATGTKIHRNKIEGSAFNGIILDTTVGARVYRNRTNNNGSGVHDAIDGFSDGGIALFNSTDNDIKDNTSKNNQGVGIFVDSLSTGNSFRANEMKGNTILDAEDLSVGWRTSGTANWWKDNEGKTDNQDGDLFDSRHGHSHNGPSYGNSHHGSHRRYSRC